MPVTLQDPTRPRDPSSRHAFPDVRPETKLRAPRTLAEDLLTERATPGRRAGGPDRRDGYLLLRPLGAGPQIGAKLEGGAQMVE